MNVRKQPDLVEDVKMSLFKGAVLEPVVNNSPLSKGAEQVILNHRILSPIILEHLSQDLFLPRLSVNEDMFCPSTGITIYYICFTLFN